MPLSGDQFKQIQDALLDAYSESSLRQMLRTRMDVNLDHVAGGSNLSEIVVNLITWAERTGSILALIEAAVAGNPGNHLLQALAVDAQGWPALAPTKNGRPPAYSSGDTFHVVIGDNARNVAIGKEIIQTVGEPRPDETDTNRRDAELAYLADLIQRYQFWAEKYTPLASIAEVRAATADGPRLDLPTLFMPTGFEKLTEFGFGPEREVKREPVDDLRSAIEEHRRLVVLGEPGSGKTTTLWRLVYDLAMVATENPDAPLPLLVPLGGYTGTQSPLDYAAGFFGDLGSLLADYLRRGRVVLLLDALNEMPQRGYRERVGCIQSLLCEVEEVSVVVTCRALDYVEELALEKLEIKPLDVFRQHEYLQRYLGEADGERFFWQLVGVDEIATLWQTWQGADGSFQDFWTADKVPREVKGQMTMAQERLWKTLRAGQLPQMLELGANPYTLVMLAQVYAGKGLLPQNRGKLFAAFVETLLAREAKRRHDAGDDWPGTESVCSGLATLAYAMQEAGERGTAVERGWAVAQLTHSPCPADDLIYNGAAATLLDINDGSVRFVHQLIQEYFAALDWQEKLPGDDLSRYWPDGWLTPSGWEETAILLACILDDMTPWVNALIPVHPALAARCIDASGGLRPADQTIRFVQDNLVDLATSPTAPVDQRAACGNALNHLGDPRPGVGVKHGLPDIDWVTVEPGRFVMGSDMAVDGDAWDGETPQFTCDLIAQPYRMARYPVTVAQFNTFVEAGGYQQQWFWTEAGWDWLSGNKVTAPSTYGEVFQMANHPRVGVSWYEAMAFCAWLSEQVGYSMTLPSEAQWERAARHIDGRLFPWGNQGAPAIHCNMRDTGIGSTSTVGIFSSGCAECGVEDMAGNVLEWCSTKWLNSYEDYANRMNDDLGWFGRGVARGGYFDDLRRDVRCAHRDGILPDDPYCFLGFRVCSSPGP